MIWSSVAINYSKGVTKDLKTKTNIPNSIGTWVLSLDECREIIKERKKDE